MVLFREPATAWRVAFLVMLVGSIVGLKATSGERRPAAPAEPRAERGT
jgi:hypothetical protein